MTQPPPEWQRGCATTALLKNFSFWVRLNEAREMASFPSRRRRKSRSAEAQLQGMSRSLPCWQLGQNRQLEAETLLRVTSWLCHRSAVPQLRSHPVFSLLVPSDWSIFHTY